MKNEKDNENKEQLTDVKDTIVGFIAPDPVEKSQEEEIKEFKLKKQNERELSKLSEEEKKKKREEYEEEEKKLEYVKTELLKSIRERIPAIEEKFKRVVAPLKKGKVVEKIRSNTESKVTQKNLETENNKGTNEKERE